MKRIFKSLLSLRAKRSNLFTRRLLRHFVPRNDTRGNRGMTLLEILLVTALISMVSLAIYNSLANGLKVWERVQGVVVEEDAMIVFEKITNDLRNSLIFSLIKFEGHEYRFSFPTIVHTPADTALRLEDGEYMDQIGQVEYYFDLTNRGFYRRQANYSQALQYQFGPPQLLIKGVESVKFRYYYLTDKEEIVSDSSVEVFPSTVEIEITISDKDGPKTLRKFINVPLNG